MVGDFALFCQARRSTRLTLLQGLAHLLAVENSVSLRPHRLCQTM